MKMKNKSNETRTNKIGTTESRSNSVSYMSFSQLFNFKIKIIIIIA